MWLYRGLFSQFSVDGHVGSTTIYRMTKLCQALGIKAWSLVSGNSECKGGEPFQYKYFPHKGVTSCMGLAGETRGTGQSVPQGRNTVTVWDWHLAPIVVQYMGDIWEILGVIYGRSP